MSTTDDAARHRNFAARHGGVHPRMRAKRFLQFAHGAPTTVEKLGFTSCRSGKRLGGLRRVGFLRHNTIDQPD